MCESPACSRRAIICFLMHGKDDRGSFCYRLDYCPVHAAEFHAKPTPNWDGTWDEIDYGKDTYESQELLRRVIKAYGFVVRNKTGQEAVDDMCAWIGGNGGDSTAHLLQHYSDALPVVVGRALEKLADAWPDDNKFW